MKALITGGNRGIGLEIATMVAAKGFIVHILSRSGIREARQGIVSWEADVADYEQTIQVTDKIGHVDVVINNTGIMNTKTATDYNSVEILHILHTNLITAVRLSVRVAEQMAGRWWTNCEPWLACGGNRPS
jgi:NAD(P)-dependent dehydrogenase (short-subunit alcohol dehydrogenase family)